MFKLTEYRDTLESKNIILDSDSNSEKFNLIHL